MPEPTLAGLERFGAPIFVPSAGWRVVAVDGGADDAPGEVVVFDDTGSIEVRTHTLGYRRQPMSMRVSNVQRASVNSPDPDVRAGWERVIVEESEREVSVGGDVHHVRVLHSHRVFNFEFDVDSRWIEVAGYLAELDDLHIERLDEVRLTR